MTNKQKLVAFAQSYAAGVPFERGLGLVGIALTAKDDLVPEDFLQAFQDLAHYWDREDKLDHSTRPVWLPEMNAERLAKQLEAAEFLRASKNG